MSRTNSQAEIVSEEQLVPRANRLVINKNNQRVASNSHITDTKLRFIVEILRHHKLYKPVSLTATVPIIYLHQFWTTINHNKNNHTFTFELDTHTFILTPRLLKIVLQMPPPDPNNSYTKPPSEIQILKFIKTLGYDEDPEIKMIAISKMVATRLHQPWRAILSFLNRSLTGKDSSWDTVRHPILQILWGIVHSANLDFASLIWDEFEWQTVERSSRPSKMSKLLYTRFTNLIINYFLPNNKSIPHRSSSSSKARRIESLKQKKQAIAGEGSSAAHNKYYDSPDNDSEAKIYSSSSNKTEESANETDDANESDMDLSDDNPNGDDNVAGYRVFMHNKSTATLNSTYLSLKVTSSSLDFIQTLLDETHANELTDFMNHPVYTDAQTTSVVHNLEGNPELTSYISGVSEVPLSTHVDVLVTKTLLQEMFLDENAHHLSSLPATKTSYPTTYPQPSLLQAKVKKLMQKAKKNMRKINFKKPDAQKFREYDQKLEALTNFNVSKAFEKLSKLKF
ncbi:hypothetical protein Tco_1260222 [Tanacetum coccineum]